MEYKIGTITHYIVSNSNEITDIWYTGDFAAVVMGNITMEEMKKDNIHSILASYADIRKKDDARGTDANRRYYITSLPESDYPKIIKVLERILNNDESLKKYF